MIDWSKLGPSSSPLPDTPTTTAPVAPAQPGGLVLPDLPGSTGSPSTTAQSASLLGHGASNLTQQQVDALDPGQRIARGIDTLGNTLFGRGNGSPFGGIPGLGDLFGAVGNVGHAIGGGVVDLTVAKPIEGIQAGLNNIPLSWATGADSNFNKIGDWAKANDPQLYQHWQLVNAAAGKDILGGGNMKADFNTEALQYLDDKSYNSSLGTSPVLAVGGAGVGSLGQAVSHAIQGWLGLLSNDTQKALGDAGFFDPSGHGGAQPFAQAQADFNAGQPLSPDATYVFKQLAAGKMTEAEAQAYYNANVGAGRDRITEAVARSQQGAELSDVEQQAVSAYTSGQWSKEHANEWLVSHGQGITRNPVGQVIGTALTDPLTYATLGAGAISTAGKVGARFLSTGMDATSTYEKLGTVIAKVQADPFLGKAFRVARGMIDPLAVYKPSTVDRAVTDLKNGIAISAFDRAYGRAAVQEVEKVAREFGKTPEVTSAVAGYSIDQANLMLLMKAQRDFLNEGYGEEMIHNVVAPNDLTDPLGRFASRDAETQLTDHMARIAQNTFTPEQEATLAGRMATTFGGDVATWEKRLPKMSFEARSALHALTYKMADKDFMEAMGKIDVGNYTGSLPLDNAVLVSHDTLTTTRAETIASNLRDVLKSDNPEKIKLATDEWNAQARRFPAMENIGYAPGGEEQLKDMISEMERMSKPGNGLTRPALTDELNDPQLRPIRDMLDRHTLPATAESEAKPLWEVGFRPDEEVAWGLKRDAATGRVTYDRAPTISHVVDAVPGRSHFSDTTRNFLGQIVGKSNAESLNRPIDSIEAFINTAKDEVTGQRLVQNIAQRFERSTFDAGIPKPISKQIFNKVREVAALDRTTIRGLSPDNVWQAVSDIIPRNLVLKDGTYLDKHIVMDHLLKASEGDLRIMGVTSKLSQRMRNRAVKAGDGANMLGQLTVTQYNRMRYTLNPTFLIQRITDAPYYSIMYGVVPVGRGLSKAGQELRKIEENIGRTALGRYFSMDMPEYATRSNFTEGIKSAMQQAGLDDNKLERILRAPDTIIANNMTNMLHARLGDMVRGALDNLAAAAEKDPALKAEMLENAETLGRTFEDWRKVYSESAGRVLDDNEVGLRYLQDMLNGWRRVDVAKNGTLDFTRLMAEGERSLPNDIGQIGPIRPDLLAKEMNYADAAALRADINGQLKKVEGSFVHVPGESGLSRFEEDLRGMNAHPDYIRRAVAYFGDTWDGFWSDLRRPVEQGGLDISEHYAKEAQNLIAQWARDRGMDPWEYLSGVMASNIGARDIQTEMGQLMAFLQSGKAEAPLEAWTKVFRSTLDVSAQKTLLEEYAAATGAKTPAGVIKPAEFTLETPKSAPGKPTRPPVAKLPKSFKAEAGYVYRVEDPNAVLSGWPKRTGVTTGAPTSFYSGKGPNPEAIFRTKLGDSELAVGRHGAGGADRLTKNAVPPENIEILGADGAWHPLSADPYDTFFETQFPEVVRERLNTDTPHPNPEVEGYIQQFSNWVQKSLGEELGQQTRHDLRRLVQQVPTNHATPFNRTHALVVSLLKNKFEDAQADIFRLAEMQTKRSVLERSLNHPMFGLYPSSYMWGKVLPETVKFLAKNPYAATYVIADVQRAIAVQREYDPEFDQKMGSIDRSAGAFLLDYLTPSLPWSDHAARMSPLFKDVLHGKIDLWKIAQDEWQTMSPERWVKQIVNAVGEVPGAVRTLQSPDQQTPKWAGPLEAATSAPAAAPAAAAPSQITGPVPASGLAPILQDDLSRLSSILLQGKSPEG